MAKHKFWRLTIYETEGGDAPALSQVYLRESSGGPNIAPQAAVTSDGSVNENLVDGLSSTFWKGTGLDGKGWILFEFATPVEITDYSLRTPRFEDEGSDAHPKTFSLEWANDWPDDRTLYVTVDLRKDQTGWGDAASRDFTTDDSLPIAGKWRMETTKLFQYIDFTGTRMQLLIYELEMRATVSGADQTGDAVAVYDYDNAAITELTDDSDATNWYGVTLHETSQPQYQDPITEPDRYVYIDFDIPIKLAEFAIRTYHYTFNPWHKEGPEKFKVEYSFDGESWVTVLNVTVSPEWGGSLETKTFSGVFSPQVMIHKETSGGAVCGGAAIIQRSPHFTGAGGAGAGGAAVIQAYAFGTGGAVCGGSASVFKGSGQAEVDGDFSIPPLAIEGDAAVEAYAGGEMTLAGVAIEGGIEVAVDADGEMELANADIEGDVYVDADVDGEMELANVEMEGAVSAG